MFENVSRIAEHVATSASRRQFLGRFGRAALSAAAAVGAFVALPLDAEAAKGCPTGLYPLHCRGRGNKKTTKICCPLNYHCQQYRAGYICCPNGMICR